MLFCVTFFFLAIKKNFFSINSKPEAERSEVEDLESTEKKMLLITKEKKKVTQVFWMLKKKNCQSHLYTKPKYDFFAHNSSSKKHKPKIIANENFESCFSVYSNAQKKAAGWVKEPFLFMFVNSDA